MRLLRVPLLFILPLLDFALVGQAHPTNPVDKDVRVIKNAATHLYERGPALSSVVARSGLMINEQPFVGEPKERRALKKFDFKELLGEIQDHPRVRAVVEDHKRHGEYVGRAYLLTGPGYPREGQVVTEILHKNHHRLRELYELRRATPNPPKGSDLAKIFERLPEVK